MSLQDKISQFDPDSPGDTSGGVFGLPFNSSEASIVIVPVPWEVTVSYRSGTAKGPQTILEASPQLDLYDEDHGNIWEAGIAMLDMPASLVQESNRLRPLAKLSIEFQEAGDDGENDEFLQAQLDKINEACKEMVEKVKTKTGTLLKKGKKVILLGGDHSTSLGYLQSLAEGNEAFAILQIDAHMDLRDTYEGFTYSHASIMHNALKLAQVSKIVQVGVRDFSQSEYKRHVEEGERLKMFSGRMLRRKIFEGNTWGNICQDIIDSLPEKVYISFDIDGLDPSYCPHTGTPVPGGLSFEEVMYLFDRIKESKCEVIGADLVEVAPGDNDYDGNVAARILYRMCNLFKP